MLAGAERVIDHGAADLGVRGSGLDTERVALPPEVMDHVGLARIGQGTGRQRQVAQLGGAIEG